MCQLRCTAALRQLAACAGSMLPLMHAQSAGVIPPKRAEVTNSYEAVLIAEYQQPFSALKIMVYSEDYIREKLQKELEPLHLVSISTKNAPSS